MKLRENWRKNKGQVLLNGCFLLFCVFYVVPVLLVISASFTDESYLNQHGFSILPQDFTLDAYKEVFRNPKQILYSYATTATYSILGTTLSVLVMALMAYPLARSSFRMKRPLNFFVLFTMLFNAGLVPNYILNTRYLHLDNTIWIYILPELVAAYYLFIIKAGYLGVPEELIEAAKLDGASEFYICFKIMIPLAKATLATVAFLIFVSKWNDWYTASVYIQEPRLVSLQYLLQKILNDAEYMKQLAKEAGVVADVSKSIPLETLKYAMAMVAAGPMLVVFPFFQKYFVKGMTIGAVKG